MVNNHLNYLSTKHPRTLIVYGCVSDPASLLNNSNILEYNQSFKLTDYFAVVSPTSPGLRFSSTGWINISPQRLLNVKSTESLFQLCQEKIILRTSQFSNPIRKYIEQYLNFISDQLEVHKIELKAEIGEDEIYDYMDWIFSAWLPLPHAQILLPPEFSGDNSSFAEVDVAYWTGGKLICVMISSTNTPIRSQQTKLDYLIENYPQFCLVKFDKDHLLSKKFPINLFPPSFSKFWNNLSLPHGPCSPDAIFNSSGISTP